MDVIPKFDIRMIAGIVLSKLCCMTNISFLPTLELLYKFLVGADRVHFCDQFTTKGSVICSKPQVELNNK